MFQRIGLRGGLFFFVVLVSLVFSGLQIVDSSEASEETIELVLLGQSLIEHDPRQYLENPLETVVPLLIDADIVMSNLEVSVCATELRCEPTRNDIFFHGTKPEVLDYLKSININLLSLSNNHSWDYGLQGIISTIDETRKRGIKHAGTGKTLADALAPAYLEIQGQKVALVAMASCKLSPDAAASTEQPGVNILLPEDDEAWQRNLTSIREARSKTDWVIVYQHFQSIGTKQWQQSWARAAIDNGADIYVSHGEPALSGVEQYNGGLIFYGLGNFIFHTRTNIGNYTSEVWESVLVNISLDSSNEKKVRFIPLVIDEGENGPNFLQKRGYPKVAQGLQGKAILNNLSKLSLPFGTDIRITGEQFLYGDLN